MSLKKKFVLLFVLFFSLLASIYIYLDLITNKVVVFDETYYLLNKNTSQKQIISELRKKNIDISYLNWKLVSLSHKKLFNPKAGEYLIPKNLPNKPKNNRNEPSHLRHIASEIASLVNIDINELANETFENSMNFFK